MINIFDSVNYDRLEIVSLDDCNCEALFTDDKNKYINFDKKVLKKIYQISENGYCDSLSAVDTIIEDDGKLYLIEFKNQKRENIKKYEIYSKAMESLAILQKYLNIKTYKLIFIVIYNGFDKGYKKIGRSLCLKDIPIEFELCRYNKIIFDEIYTLDKQSFLRFKTHFNFAKEWK
jgi:hypothetical protein